MIVDFEKAKELDCTTCDKPTQALRNCSGLGRPATIILNQQLYTRCPRAIHLENLMTRYLIDVYHHCKEMKTFPHPGASGAQTAFTIQLFEFLDDLFMKARIRQAESKKN